MRHFQHIARRPSPSLKTGTLDIPQPLVHPGNTTLVDYYVGDWGPANQPRLVLK